jgi:hypothetical protein
MVPARDGNPEAAPAGDRVALAGVGGRAGTHTRGAGRGELRFAFDRRVSTEYWQDSGDVPGAAVRAGPCAGPKRRSGVGRVI